VTGITRDNTGLVLVGESTDNGHDLTLDNHAEKGSGLHGGYVGAFPGGAARWTQGVFVLDVHDQPTGAGLECGPYLRDSSVFVKAKNLTFEPVSQTGGNAIQLYGACSNVTAQVEADNVRRAVDLQLWAEATGNRVTHGRIINARLPDPYEADPAGRVVYTDCL
jgi:hypothetical protein